MVERAALSHGQGRVWCRHVSYPPQSRKISMWRLRLQNWVQDSNSGTQRGVYEWGGGVSSRSVWTRMGKWQMERRLEGMIVLGDGSRIVWRGARIARYKAAEGKRSWLILHPLLIFKALFYPHARVFRRLISQADIAFAIKRVQEMIDYLSFQDQTTQENLRMAERMPSSGLRLSYII